MKGRFVSGKQIDAFVKELLYEGNLLSYDARIERLSAAWKLGVLPLDEARHYMKSINVKFGPVPTGELFFEEMLK